MTDTHYDWATERARATQLFGGDTPGPQLEARIIEIFAENPVAVTRAIDRVAERWARGDIRSPWAVLRVEVIKAITPAEFVRATDNTTRAQAEARAEQWMRTCGLHFDRWDEVHDELFGDRGRLHTWADNPGLVDRMRQLYDTHRPTGEDLDHDEHERAERWQQHRAPRPTVTA